MSWKEAKISMCMKCNYDFGSLLIWKSDYHYDIFMAVHLWVCLYVELFKTCCLQNVPIHFFICFQTDPFLCRGEMIHWKMKFCSELASINKNFAIHLINISRLLLVVYSVFKWVDWISLRGGGGPKYKKFGYLIWCYVSNIYC